ncbi:hypothetical protein [Pseudopedobacter sp.]|uniref:hypothetical protein n=1 Tax=Pseudopedobacter sp. TaxID=1936787 RepID=UPI003341972F
MKKTIFTLAVIFITMAVQAQQFQKGTTMTNVGIGLGTTLGGLGNERPAISASADYGVWDINGPGVISLGGYVGNTGYKYMSGNYTYKWNYFVLGARSAYHYNGFTSVPKLDVYGGAMLGYNIVKYSSDGDDMVIADNYGSGMGLSVFLGGRWFFSDNIGAYAELGYGVSVLNAGVTVKF